MSPILPKKLTLSLFALLFLFYSEGLKGQCPLKLGDTITLNSLTQGLVLYHPYTGNAQDASGYGNHGTPKNGPTLTTDRFSTANSAYLFDGVNDFIEVSDNNSLDVADSFSITMWVYQTGNASGGYRFFDKTTVGVNDGYNFDTYSSSGRRMRLTGGANNPNASASYSLNAWHQILVIHENAHNTRFYQDGSFVGGDTQSNIRTNNLPVRIGANQSGGNCFVGKIDEVRLYNRALCDQEIRVLYGTILVLKLNHPTAVCNGMGTNINIINPQPFTQYQLIKASDSTNVGSPQASRCADTIKLATDPLTQTSKFRVKAKNTSSSCEIILDTLITISIADTFNITIDTTVCKAKGFYFNGAQRYNDSTYTVHLTTVYGCDSNVTLNLSTFSNYPQSKNFTICQGDSIFLQKAYRKTGGTYYDTIKHTGECDTVIASVLTIKGYSINNQNPEICAGDSLFLQKQYRKTTGTYYDTIKRTGYCDSIIISSLNVKSLAQGSRNISICSNDSIYLQKAYRKTAGTYYDTIKRTGLCDSILTSVLSINNLSQGSQNVSICSNDSIYLQKAYRKSAGVFYDTIKRPGLCDSVLISTLSINNLGQGTQAISICNKDSVFLQKAYRRTAGTYYDTLQRTGLCDSVVTSILTIRNSSSGTQNISICANDSIFLQKAYRKTAGQYYDTLIGFNGCDSVLKANLTVKNILTHTISPEICLNDSFRINGKYIKTAGTYHDTALSSAGCDSITTVNLTYHSTSASIFSKFICSNDSFYFNSKYLKSTGVYFDTVFTNKGCIDTVIRLELSVVNTSTGNKSFDICQGQSITINGKPVSVSGTYFDSARNAAGCDNITTIVLTVHAPGYSTVIHKFCTGDSLLYSGSYYKTDTLFHDTLTSVYGCDSIVTHKLARSQGAVVLPDSAYCCEDFLTNVDAGIKNSYLWSNGYTGRYLQTNIEGIYTLTVVDTFNCNSSDTVKVIERCEPKVFIPNSFTPNNDHINNYLTINAENVSEIRFTVFNRWGEIVFDSQEKNIVWDGKFKDKTLPIDTYFWTCHYNGLLANGLLMKKNETGILYIIR